MFLPSKQETFLAQKTKSDDVTDVIILFIK